MIEAVLTALQAHAEGAHEEAGAIGRRIHDARCAARVAEDHPQASIPGWLSHLWDKWGGPSATLAALEHEKAGAEMIAGRAHDLIERYNGSREWARWAVALLGYDPRKG